MSLRHGCYGEQVGPFTPPIVIIVLTPLSWRVMPYPTQPGQVGGHEGVGIVHKLGVGSEKSNIKVGDRVGIKVNAYLTGQKIYVR